VIRRQLALCKGNLQDIKHLFFLTHCIPLSTPCSPPELRGFDCIRQAGGQIPIHRVSGRPGKLSAFWWDLSLSAWCLKAVGRLMVPLAMSCCYVSRISSSILWPGLRWPLCPQLRADVSRSRDQEYKGADENRLRREAAKRYCRVYVLEAFKVRLDGALSNLIQLKTSLLIVQGLD